MLKFGLVDLKSILSDLSDWYVKLSALAEDMQLRKNSVLGLTPCTVILGNLWLLKGWGNIHYIYIGENFTIFLHSHMLSYCLWRYMCLFVYIYSLDWYHCLKFCGSSSAINLFSCYGEIVYARINQSFREMTCKVTWGCVIMFCFLEGNE